MSLEWIGIFISWLGLAIAFWQLYDVRRSRKRTESPFFEFGRLLIRTPQWKNAKGEDVFVFSEPRDGTEVPDGLVCLVLAVVTIMTIIGPIIFGILGLWLLLYGGRQASWVECSACGGRLSHTRVSLCPHCHARF
jgi:hypothetical protein